MADILIGDRKVQSSGVILIDDETASATIAIKDLHFVFKVLVSQDPPTCSYKTPDNKTGVFTFVGSIGLPGHLWVYDNVGSFGSKAFGATIRVQKVSSQVARRPVFAVTYTFADMPDGKDVGSDA